MHVSLVKACGSRIYYYDTLYLCGVSFIAKSIFLPLTEILKKIPSLSFLRWLALPNFCVFEKRLQDANGQQQHCPCGGDCVAALHCAYAPDLKWSPWFSLTPHICLAVMRGYKASRLPNTMSPKNTVDSCTREIQVHCRDHPGKLRQNFVPQISLSCAAPTVSALFIFRIPHVPRPPYPESRPQH